MKNKSIILICTGILTGITLAVLELNGISYKVTLLFAASIALIALMVYLLVTKEKRTSNKPKTFDRKKILKQQMVIAYYDLLFILPSGITYFLMVNSYKT